MNLAPAHEESSKRRYSVVPLSRHGPIIDLVVLLLLLLCLGSLVSYLVPLLVEALASPSGTSYWQAELELMLEDIDRGYTIPVLVGFVAMDPRWERYGRPKYKSREHRRRVERARSRIIPISETSRFGTAIALACITIGFPVFLCVPLLGEFAARSLFADVDIWFRSWSGPRPFTVNNIRIAISALWALMTGTLMCGHRISIGERFRH